jgi:hypothetical protein
VQFSIAASANLRDQMLSELNEIGSEDAATQWAHRRLKEKNRLNASNAEHVAEAFRTKLLSFAIHSAGACWTQKASPKMRTARRRAGQLPWTNPC